MGVALIFKERRMQMFNAGLFIERSLISGTEEEEICVKQNPNFKNLSEEEKTKIAERIAMHEIADRA